MNVGTHHKSNTQPYLVMVAALLAAFALIAAIVFQAQGVAAAPTTVQVNLEIQAHTGAILNIDSASYYSGGWHDVTASRNPNDSRMVRLDLAPGTYTFAVTYNGTSAQKAVTVGTSAMTVYFHAALVNVELQAHNGSVLDIPNDGSASYYAGGWHAITGVNVNNNSMVQAEMLPGTYNFAVTYKGTQDSKTQTIAEPNINDYNPSTSNKVQSVYFQTMLVNIALQPNTGPFLSIPNDGSASYYANGWHSITTLNVNNHALVTAEMLPGTYTFAATYHGTQDQKMATVGQPNANLPANQNVQTVYFHTLQVISDSGTATSYYANGWQSFTSGDQMLPGTYTFAFSDATPNTPETLTWSSTHKIQHIH